MPFKLTTIGILMAAAFALSACVIVVDGDDDDDNHWNKDSKTTYQESN